jgi:hypothetical protein
VVVCVCGFVFAGVFAGAGAYAASVDTDDQPPKHKQQQLHEKRVVELLFEEKFGVWLGNQATRYKIFAGFGVLLIVCLVFGAQVGAATRPDQWFDKDHKFQRIFDITK